MANFSSSITFTKDNLDNNKNIIKKIEYKYTHLNDDKLWSTYYINKIDNNGSKETFNKLYKNGNNVYEKIGNSNNKDSWDIKEFFNTNLEKQYVDNYHNISFNDNLLDACENIPIENQNLLK
tara:strand:- start:1682 stop:2047 length:366 start_codon:yes stop_codon:yes gene_type:complete